MMWRMITDPEELQGAWRDWVVANLGKDGARGAAAAHAAAEAAQKGAGFEAATEAARRAWLSVAPQSGPAQDKFPAALNVAMGLAIGGAVASTLLAAALGVLFGQYVGGVAAGFLLYNLAVVGINWALLSAMRRRISRAWTIAVVLVSVGIGFDVVEQVLSTFTQGPGGTPWTASVPLLAAPGWFIDLGVMVPMFMLRMPDVLAIGLGSSWLVVHLLTIQLPILLLLIAGRNWFRAPARAVAALSGSGGTPDAAF